MLPSVSSAQSCGWHTRQRSGLSIPPYATSTPTLLFGLKQTFIPFTNFISFYCLQVHYSECHLFVSMLFAIVWWFLRSLEPGLEPRVLYIGGKWYVTEVYLSIFRDKSLTLWPSYSTLSSSLYLPIAGIIGMGHCATQKLNVCVWDLFGQFGDLFASVCWALDFQVCTTMPIDG